MRRKYSHQIFVFVILTIFQLQLFTTKANHVLIDEDTIAVGEVSDAIDSRSDQELKKQRTEYANINGRRVMVGCTTARKAPGECRSFRECYPIFKLRDSSVSAGKKIHPSADDNRVNDALKDIYRGISGPCSRAILDTISNALGVPISKQNYVCCPNQQVYSNATKPTRNTMSPALQEPTTYQNSQCGKVFLERNSENDTKSDVPTNDEEDADPQGRIVNGRVANRAEFPWTVALMTNGRQFCGGSLVDSKHILTAAHCVYFMNRNDVNRLRVQIGDHNIYSTNDGRHEVRGVSNVYYHRSFNMRTIYDDVAILRLSNPVTYTRFIQPICLSTNTWGLENSMASVAGWGQVSERGQQSSVLRTVNVRIWKQADCIRRYKGRAPAGISNGMVCAGGSGYDSCKGDSGGPLSIKRGSSVSQVGIVSWGIGCGSFPGVYTRVDQYLSWINKNRRS